MATPNINFNSKDMIKMRRRANLSVPCLLNSIELELLEGMLKESIPLLADIHNKLKSEDAKVIIQDKVELVKKLAYYFGAKIKEIDEL